MTFCDFVRNQEIRPKIDFFKFFSKPRKATWEYWRDPTDHHSSGESAQIKKAKHRKFL